MTSTKTRSPKEVKSVPVIHARVVPFGTSDTKRLARMIHDRCTVIPADVTAVLSSLTDVIVEELSDGRHVHIKGLGFMQIVPECPPVQFPKEIRAESIHFKTIAFRPEIELKKCLRTVRFERTPNKITPATPPRTK